MTFEQTIEESVNCLSSFALKCNESIFKGYFESLIKWSKITHDYTNEVPEMMQRKLTMIKALNQIIRTIGRFGINYYGHVYDYYLGFLEHCLSTLPSGGDKFGSKRPHSITLEKPFYDLHRLVMQSLTLLFQNDKKGFVDVLKFEKLVKPLTGQFKLSSLADNSFLAYANETLIPPILALFSLVTDDYMWKNILYNVSPVDCRWERT